MKVSIYIYIIIFIFLILDIIPGINNYNPLKIKNRKFGNQFNNLNIIGNNNRENNFMRKPKNQNVYNRFNGNNYDSTKPIKLLNNPVYKYSTSTDKVNKKIKINNFNLYGQDIGATKQPRNINSVDPKRPSTAPQKYKISKNKGGHVFGYGIKNTNKGLPHTFSNGFYSHHKRLPSPMISGQKFGTTQHLKFNNYRLPMPNNNLLSIKSKKKSFN